MTLRSQTRIREIEARHYKAFHDTVKLELAPLTVVFGRNGSGKSAIARLPLLLAAALRGESGAAPGFPLSTRGLRFGSSLRSFRHGGNADTVDIRVLLEFPSGESTRLEVEVRPQPRANPRLPGQWIRHWHAERAGDSWEFTWYRDHFLLAGERLDGLSFSGLVPRLANGGAHEAATAIRPAPSVVHLGPVRILGDDDFTEAQPGLRLDVGLRGEHTRRVLDSHLSEGRNDAIERVQQAARHCLGIDLDIQETGLGAVQGTITRARVNERETWLPLAELGTGLAHALPVITQYAVVASSRAGDDGPTLVVCEEPEAHLHPQAQADIADVVIKTAQAGADCLVETHSETFVLRVRRRVAEGLLRPEDVAFYWVDDEVPVTELRRLGLEPDGHVHDWPEGWFDSALDEVRAIHRAQKAPTDR